MRQYAPVERKKGDYGLRLVNGVWFIGVYIDEKLKLARKADLRDHRYFNFGARTVEYKHKSGRFRDENK